MAESKGNGIVILGKYSLMKEGVSRVLQANGFRILTSISNIERLKSRPRIHRVLFLIVHASDDFSLVVSEIELLREQYPEAHVAVVAEHFGLAEPPLAFKAGAIGYLVNAVSSDAFVKSIELLMLGEAIFPPTFSSCAPPAEKPRRRPKDDPAALPDDEKASLSTASESAATPLLSPRETAILLCLIEGDSNKFIARKIGITEATVKAHVKAILRKIRVQNRTQAAIWGMNNALLLQPANSNALLMSANAENA